MLSSSSQSEVNLVGQVLEQGQKLRAAMVKTLLTLDPFYSEVEGPKRMHSINMDEVKLEERVTTEDKHKFALYLRGDSMELEEEKGVLETFRGMSTSDICEVTEKNYSSLQRNCRCETCQAYKQLESYEKKQEVLAENERFTSKKQGFVPKNKDFTSKNKVPTSKNKDSTLKNKDFSSKNKDFTPESSTDNLEVSPPEAISNSHRKILKFVDTMKITVHSVKLEDEGWMKVCQGVKVVGGTVTFFVEYEVPAGVAKGVVKKRGRVDSGLETSNFVRVCSKKMVKEVIYFKQTSVHDVSNLSDLDLSQTDIKFRISARAPRQKAMNVLGVAKFKMAAFLASTYLACSQDLVIFLSSDAPIALGSLKVSLDLGCGRLYYGRSFIDSVSEGKENKVLPEIVTPDTVKMDDKDKPKHLDTATRIEPVRLTTVKAKVKEKKDIATKKEENIKIPEKTILFGFIYVSQVEYLSVKSDTYFTCQPFCQDDTAYSNVVSCSFNPLFNFYQKIPFIYEESFLSKLRDNFMLFEFWEKVDRKDSLVGVARIPLHQYYLAFRNPTILKYLDRNQLPVIGTDWFEPISDPSTGAITGQAQILVALGSEAQIQCLETERGFKDNIVKRAQRIIDRPIRAQPDRSRPIRDDLDTCRGCNLHSSGVSRRSQALQNAISGRGAHKENKGRSQSLEEHNTGRSLVLEGTSGRSQVCESTSGRGQGLEEAIVGRSQGTSGRSQVCESTSGRSQGFEEAIVGRSQTTSGRSQVCENTTGRSQGFEETTVGRSQVLEGTSRGRSQVCEDKTGRSQGFEEALVGRSQLLEGTCARSPVLEGSSGRSQVGTAGRSQIIEGESGRSQEEERLKGQFKCILSRDVSEIIISEEFTTRKTGNNEDKQPEVVTDSVCRKLDETFCLETEVTQPETGSEKRTISVGTQSNEVSVVSDVVKLDKGTNKVLTYDRACQSDKMDQSKSDVLESLLQQLITHRPSSTTHEASTNTDPSATPNPAPKRKTTDLLNTLQRALTEPKDSFKARIRIDSALHLPSRKKCKAKKKGKASREEILPSTYVTFDSCQDVKITQIVHRNVNPKWEFSCDVSLPTELLTSNQKRLIFKVWKKGRNGGQEPNQQVDSVLGFAALDLTVLVAGLPTVHGWFNILDFSGKCNGQIKISLTPLEEIDKKNLTTTPTATKTPTPTLAPPLEPQSDLEPLEDPEPQETLSRALKRKFTELDEITQRLRSRLSNVTSNEESDASNDEVADEFEQDINTLCIEDDYDMIDFVREAQDMNLMRVSHSLQRLQQTAPEDNQTLIFSSDDYNPSEPSDTSSDLDKQLIEGKQRIDTLLEKLSIGGFGGRFVSGCSDAGGSADAPRQEEILKELGIEREFDARGLFDSKVFGELGGVRHAPDGDTQ